MTPFCYIHELLVAKKAIDRVRDETLRPASACGLDLRLTISSRSFGLPQNAGIGLCENGVAKDRPWRRHITSRKVHLGRCRPMIAKEIFDRGNGCTGAFE